MEGFKVRDNSFFAFRRRNGYTVIPISMARGLDIRLSTAVKHVRYDKDGVEVRIPNSCSDNRTEYRDIAALKVRCKFQLVAISLEVIYF